MMNTIPAVVIGAELNGLGVVRSLARGGVPAIALDTTYRLPAMRSRLCRKMTMDRLYGPVLVRRLTELRKKISHQPVLMPTHEMVVRTISEHRDELHDSCLYALPPRNVVAMLQNKARFFEFATHFGLPVPRTVILRRDTPLSSLSTLPFPVVVKPAENLFNQAGEKTPPLRIATLKEAETICRKILDITNEVVVQEWIEGPDSNICFALFHHARAANASKIFFGRKISSYPAHIGRTVLCLPAPEMTNDLEPWVANFFELTHYEGLGTLEFKWDPRQRRFVIIGQTVGHTDWQGEIATLSGVNLPLAAYEHAVGQTSSPQSEVDCNVAWRESAILREKIPMLSAAMRTYDGYWRSNDSRPGVSFYARASFEKFYRKVFKPSFSGGKVKDRIRDANLSMARRFGIW